LVSPAKVEAVWAIKLLKNAFRPLRQIHQFVGRIDGQGGQTVDVGIGHGQYMAAGVGVGVEADEAMFRAQDQATGGFGLIWTHAVGDGEVDGSNEVAENTSHVARPSGQFGRNAGARIGIRRGDVGIAPGCKEKIHAGRAVKDSIGFRPTAKCAGDFPPCGTMSQAGAGGRERD